MCIMIFSPAVRNTDRSTDTTGQSHARAAGGPSQDPTFQLDSGALASVTTAIV